MSRSTFSNALLPLVLRRIVGDRSDGEMQTKLDALPGRLETYAQQGARAARSTQVT